MLYEQVSVKIKNPVQKMHRVNKYPRFHLNCAQAPLISPLTRETAVIGSAPGRWLAADCTPFQQNRCSLRHSETQSYPHQSFVLYSILIILYHYFFTCQHLLSSIFKQLFYTLKMTVSLNCKAQALTSTRYRCIIFVMNYIKFI